MCVDECKTAGCDAVKAKEAQAKMHKCDDNCKIEFDMQGAVYDYDKLIKNTQLEPTD